MTLEYRVEWRFKDKPLRSKVFQQEHTARGRYEYLSKLDPEDLVCCDGSVGGYGPCGCNGETVGEKYGELIYAGLFVRECTPWKSLLVSARVPDDCAWVPEPGVTADV